MSHPFTALRHVFGWTLASALLLLALIAAAQGVGALRHGDVLAFTSDRDGDLDIYLYDLTLGLTIALTHNTLRDDNPAWSPDGQWLAFNRWASPDNSEIYVMDAFGRRVRRLTDNDTVDAWPSWSPDGTHLLFYATRAGQNDVYVMSREGGDAHQVRQTNLNDSLPRYSPDGTQIAFTSNADIFVMSSDGSTLRRLTQTPWYDSQAEWSPDGQRILFVSERESLTVGRQNPGIFNIYLMDTSGTLLTQLSADLGFNQQARWSPDGTRIVFVSMRGGESRLYLMGADGGQVRALETGGSGLSPAWMP
ncbi:MAG: PD40 domain-containing protein [Chloroflexi bacterium]|nr:PD40 domain-containing protein [Chloroflexota bacterium]